MKSCPYCDAPMPNPRRVQCGRPECRRRYDVERTLRYRARYKTETGNDYRERYTTAGRCEDCGARILLRPDKQNTRCRRCCARVAGAASGARRKEQARQRRLPVLYEGESFKPEPKPQGPLPPLRRCWYMGYCPRCGRAFIHDSPQTKTCSAKCTKSLEKARRRARKRDAFVEDVSPRGVFERDRWTCHLCGTRVAWSKEVPHPRAPVVDHVIPLAAGPEVGGVHAPYNARCAHFLCNSIKSDSLAQPALF